MDKEIGGYLKKNLLQMYLQPLGIISRNMPFFVTLIWGCVMILNKGFSAGGLIAFLYLLQFMTDPLQRIPDMISEVRGISVSGGRIKSLLDTPAEGEGEEQDIPASI